MRKASYFIFYFLIIINLLTSSCVGFKNKMNDTAFHPKDLIDSRPNVTTYILDKQLEHWNEKYTNSIPDSIKLKTLFESDSIAIIKPIISVCRVTDPAWDKKPEMLDATFSNNLIRMGILENNFEFNWYAYFHKNITGPGPDYLPCLSDSDYKIIKAELNSMENIFDNNKLTEYKMSAPLYSVLSKVPATYYVLYSLKQRYGLHFAVKGPVNNNFVRMRMFVFNKKNRNILYYNKVYREYNTPLANNYLPNLYFLSNDFFQYHLSLYKSFSHIK